MKASAQLGRSAFGLRSSVFGALVLALWLSPAPSAYAQLYVNTNGGEWSYDFGWEVNSIPANAIPPAGSDVLVSGQNPYFAQGSYELDLDVSYTSTNPLNSLTIDAGPAFEGASEGTYFVQNSGSMYALSETVDTTGITVYGYGAFYEQNGGSNTVTGTLDLGEGINYESYIQEYVPSNGIYNLESTGQLFAGTEIVGDQGVGEVNQSGSTLNQVNNLILGNVNFPSTETSGPVFYPAGGGSVLISNTPAGIYNLSGDSTDVIQAGQEIVGNYGQGIFNQTGGSNNVSGNLELGHAAGASGQYNLQGGTLSVTGAEYIGFGNSAANNDAADFNQTTADPTSPSINNAGTIDVGYGLGSVGTYELGQGANTDTFSSISASTEIIGDQGKGTFTQYGGANVLGKVTNPGNLIVGNQSGSTGEYTLSNGTLTVYGTEYIGYGNSASNNDTADFNEYLGNSANPGPVNNVGTLDVGYGVGSVGTYELGTSGDTTSAIHATNEIISDQGSGIFTQNGGLNSISNSLYIGNQMASTGGTYNLYGGELSAANEYVGYNGVGDFSYSSLFQYAGSNVVTGSLVVGSGYNFDYDNYSVAATGHYTLSNGSSTSTTTLSAANEVIGDAGTGYFFQYDYTSNTAGVLTLGNQYSAEGIYYQYGGTINAGSEIIGNQGYGDFLQYGGVNNVGTVSAPGDLVIAGNGNPAPGFAFSFSSGAYTLSGGTLTVTGTEYVGSGAATQGQFSQTGGSNTTANLSIAAGSTYTINSTSSAASLTVTGNTNASIPGHTQNSGSLSIIGNGGTAVSLANYNSVGGTLQVDPATVNFTSISLDSTSVVSGSAGDVFNITGNFTDDISTAANNNLAPVTLDFQGGGTHTLNWDSTGSIGEIKLASGDDLTLNLTGNLDVETLAISSTAQLTITGSGSLIYDSANAANNYLEDQEYNPNGGGALEPSSDVTATPEPSTWALLLGGGVMLLWWQRRRKGGKPHAC